MRPTRAAARRSARHTVETGCLPLLLGLAPGGVFPAAAVTGGAVRSYRTVSPLPPVRPRPEAVRRCPFCGTVPGVAPAGRYPAPYLRGARTFLPPPSGGERPSDRLALEIWDFASCVSKPEGACTQTAAWDFMGCITSAAHGRIGIVPRGCASIIAANHPGTAEKEERHAGNTRNRRLPVRGRR